MEHPALQMFRDFDLRSRSGITRVLNTLNCPGIARRPPKAPPPVDVAVPAAHHLLALVSIQAQCGELIQLQEVVPFYIHTCIVIQGMLMSNVTTFDFRCLILSRASMPSLATPFA